MAFFQKAKKNRWGNIPTTIRESIAPEWAWDLPKVVELDSLEKIQKSLNVPYGGGEYKSSLRSWVYPKWEGGFWETPPTAEEMALAAERGMKRFEEAIEKSLPEKWEACDALYARMPELLSHVGKFDGATPEFWVTVFEGNGQTQTCILSAGKDISLPWYSGDAVIGFTHGGDFPASKMFHPQVKFPVVGSPGSNHFTCPSPEQVLCEGGLDNIKSIILRHCWRKTS